MAIIIFSPNISIGGGASLLNEIISISNNRNDIIFILDSRYKFDDIKLNKNKFIYTKPHILNRFLINLNLKLITQNDDVILCFGNLPPLFKVRGCVFTYIQNRFIADDNLKLNFPLKTKLRLILERLLFKISYKNSKFFIVQTRSMKEILLKRIKDKNIFLFPFINSDFNKIVWFKYTTKDFDFIYPASGDFHKNHVNLIEAWILLSKVNIYPTLALTLNENISTKLIRYILNAITCYSLRISLIGNVHQKELINLYIRTGALIYPSLVESFGLPLLEAKKIGMPIIASDLNYVFDVVKPTLVFNPHDPNSIFRVIKNYLGYYDDIMEVKYSFDLINELISRKSI